MQPVEGSQESLLRPLPVGGDDGDDGGDGNGEDRGHRDQPADTVRPAGIHVVTPGGNILNTMIKGLYFGCCFTWTWVHTVPKRR